MTPPKRPARKQVKDDEPGKKAKPGSAELRTLRRKIQMPEFYCGPNVSDYRAKQVCVKALAKYGVMGPARAECGISKKTFDEWLQNDPAFVDAVKEALEWAADRLELTARKRALKQSDYLMVVMLKATRPEKFMEKSRTELTGADGGPIELEAGSRQRLKDKIMRMKEAASKGTPQLPPGGAA